MPSTQRKSDPNLTVQRYQFSPSHESVQCPRDREGQRLTAAAVRIARRRTRATDGPRAGCQRAAGRPTGTHLSLRASILVPLSLGLKSTGTSNERSTSDQRPSLPPRPKPLVWSRVGALLIWQAKSFKPGILHIEVFALICLRLGRLARIL
jgi:hypothetical protein